MSRRWSEFSNGRGVAVLLATVCKVWGIAAREGVGKLEVGVAFAPSLVAYVM